MTQYLRSSRNKNNHTVQKRKENSLALDRKGFELIANGHTAFQLLWAGIKLGVFDFLSKSPGSNRLNIAKITNLLERPTRILLEGLMALRLIEKHRGGYKNAEIVEQEIISKSKGSLVPVIRWYAEINYPGLEMFVDALKENTNSGLVKFPGKGKTLYERLAASDGLENVFQEAMSALSTRTNPALLESFDFRKLKTVIDVGGGDGTNTISLVRRFPHLKAIVFDIPSVCARATVKIFEAGFADKIKVVPGDFLKDPFPKGADGILFNHIMPIWSEAKNISLFKRSYDALPEKGFVFVFNMVSNNDGSGPMTPAFGSVYFLTIATGEGMLYTTKEYKEWMRRAGFLKVSVIRHLPLDHMLLVGKKG